MIFAVLNTSRACLIIDDLYSRPSLSNRYRLLETYINQNWAFISDAENFLNNLLVVRILSNGKLSDDVMMVPNRQFGNSELDYTLEYPEGSGNIILRKWGQISPGEWDCCPVVNGFYDESQCR